MSDSHELGRIALELGSALGQGGEPYALVLEKHLGDEVDFSHEPPLPMDRVFSRDEYLATQRMVDQAFARAMPDFRCENIYARAVGDTIYLFCDRKGTMADGTVLDSMLFTRFRLERGKIRKVVMAFDPESDGTRRAALEAGWRQAASVRLVEDVRALIRRNPNLF